MNIKQIIREEIERVLLEGKIPLRLIQAGAMQNHGSGYKISYDTLNMMDSRKTIKGFHGSSSKGNIGVYFYSKKEANIVKSYGNIMNIRNPKKGQSAFTYAISSAIAMNSEFAYVYEADTEDDFVLLEDGAPGQFNVNELNEYIPNTKVQYKEVDGIGYPGAEIVVWNKEAIKSFKPVMFAVKNPYYNSFGVASRWSNKEPLNLSQYVWFNSEQERDSFLNNVKKDKWGYLASIMTPQQKAA
jgi:hypothetical protein